jgi:hypothetical protein
MIYNLVAVGPSKITQVGKRATVFMAVYAGTCGIQNMVESRSVRGTISYTADNVTSMHCAVGPGVVMAVQTVVLMGDRDDICRCSLRMTCISAVRTDGHGIGSATLRLVVNIEMGPTKVGIIVETT